VSVTCVLAGEPPTGGKVSRAHGGRPELLDRIFASVELFPAGEDGKRRHPDADSHVGSRERLPFVEGDPGERQRTSPQTTRL